MLRNIHSKSVAVLGFHDGSAGQVSEWFEDVTGFEIACYVHEAKFPLDIDPEIENKKRMTRKMEYPTKTMYRDKPLITSLNWIGELLQYDIKNVLALTPENQIRKRQIGICEKNGIRLVSAIHPSVIILEKSEIADGVWINAGSVVGFKAEIEAGVLINTGVKIDHHNVLKSCCQLDPGVTTAGNVGILECAHIHTGATIINRIHIGENSVIGAGSVVVKNIPSNSLAYGIPAKVKKQIYG